jgi:2-amino-4-hydroxy-6-hydroxymethyldihydropteridine diphosphokinase
MKASVYLSLGSNLGQRADYLNQALQRIAATEEIDVIRCSSVYETDPVGYTEQPSFLNQVVQVETTLDPETLLSALQRIEQALGRKREVRWGPRTIDIDILLYNDIRVQTEKLTLPHPRMKERTFVLVPLSEVAPSLMLPGDTVTVEERCEMLKGEGVQKWTSKSFAGGSESEHSVN